MGFRLQCSGVIFQTLTLFTAKSLPYHVLTYLQPVDVPIRQGKLLGLLLKHRSLLFSQIKHLSLCDPTVHAEKLHTIQNPSPLISDSDLINSVHLSLIITAHNMMELQNKSNKMVDNTIMDKHAAIF
ncbi:hypothetical protein ILYODFUR_036319 [Ilyodon furcidens]|uniref:Uncharacterized protein n=1 Tax=Ilyodon furcidens TaxID=33524 RepID=A0ABV0VK10_9TELE